MADALVPLLADRGPGTEVVDGSRGRRIMEQTVAALALIVLGLRQLLTQGLTSGYLVAIVIVPVWYLTLRLFRGARLLVACGVLALLSGIVLTVLAQSDHEVRSGIAADSALLLVGTICGVGVILWSRTVLSAPYIGLYFGAGMLAGAVLLPAEANDNAWKFVYCVPVAVVALALVNRQRGKGTQVAVLLALAALSVLFDSRSYFGTFLVAALLMVWQMRPDTVSRRVSWVRTVAFFGGLSVAVYYLGTTLLVDGYLGQAAQLRSVAQIDTSGSLILGGRPELAASMALITHRPWGFGVGVVPTLHDVLVAKTGMFAINYDPNNGYVDDYMFGGQIELHSVFGDLWSNYGIAGLLLVGVIAGLVIRSLAESIARRTASGLVLFLSCWTLWNLLFSPLFAAAPTLMITLGIVLAERSPNVFLDHTPDTKME